MNANAKLSTIEGVDRDRSHQLILIETMVRDGASECQIVAAVAGRKRRPKRPLARLRQGLGSMLAA